MLALGFFIGAVLCSPVAFALGLFANRARRMSTERADIGPALRRSVS